MSKRKRCRKNRIERFITSVMALAFIAAAVYATARCLIHAPKLAREVPISQQDASAESLSREDTQTEAEESAQARKEFCFTILVSGLDDGNGGSDTNILVRFDADGKRIDLVSLPRDTLLHRDWHSNKLNYAFVKGGTELLRSEISNLLGVPVDFYVTVNLSGFVTLIDQIGGVDFDVPVNMDYDDPAQDLHIHFSRGMQHLNGQQAMEVVRWRKNNDGTGYAAADIGRIGTQQAFLIETAKQLLQVSNVKNISAIADIFFSNIKTDLTPGNLIWFGTEALEIGLDNVHFHTLPGDGTGYYHRESVYVLDRDATAALVNEALNPFLVPVSIESMDILVP